MWEEHDDFNFVQKKKQQLLLPPGTTTTLPQLMTWKISSNPV